MLPAFVAADLWFAGYCAFMVNVSDSLAMGGRPYAVVACAILPRLADEARVAAGKDVSMAGIAGTWTMLCEGSGGGATLALDALPRPLGVDLARWLRTFPSVGYLLAAGPDETATIAVRFAEPGLACAEVGDFGSGRRGVLRQGEPQAASWDFERAPPTGFGERGGATRWT